MTIQPDSSNESTLQFVDSARLFQRIDSSNLEIQPDSSNGWTLQFGDSTRLFQRIDSSILEIQSESLTRLTLQFGESEVEERRGKTKNGIQRMWI
ncbi:hypothetical protein ACF0H5_013298 [Mactra antiquata]